MLLCLAMGDLQGLVLSRYKHYIISKQYKGSLRKVIEGLPPTRVDQAVRAYAPLPAELQEIIIQFLAKWFEGVKIQDRGSWLVNEIFPCITFSEENNIVSGCSDGFVKAYDICSGICTATIAAHRDSGRSYGVRTLLYDPEAKKIISGGDDDYIKIWDNGRFIKRFERSRTESHLDSVSCLALLGNNVFISGSTLINNLYLWDCEAGKIGTMFSGVYRDFGAGGTASVAVLNEDRCVSTLKSSYIILWDAARHVRTSKNKIHGNNLFAASYAHDTYALAHDKDIQLCDIRCPNNPSFLGDHAAVIQKVVRISSDLLSASPDGIAKLWDPRMPTKCKETIPVGCNGDDILALASSPKGDHFAVSFGNSKQVKLFSLARSTDGVTL